ncbi:hypothetical protein B5S27_g2607 [[Candida] boidinii]|nr:hypothetical protein B5S27_g2607 [[Candida] boidinii]
MERQRIVRQKNITNNNDVNRIESNPENKRQKISVGSGNSTDPGSSNSKIISGTNTFSTTVSNPGVVNRPTLTEEQKAIIERNRQKALERRRKRDEMENGSLRNASSQKPNVNSGISVRETVDSKVSGSIHVDANTNKIVRPLDRIIRPSVKKSDYIDYDLSTMKDTFGGFLGDSSSGDGKNGNPMEGKSLEEWKFEQNGKASSFLKDPAPPVDVENAPKCYECNSIEIDIQLYKNFGCRVCKKCIELKPEKYSLLTKTECREDYLLTDPELKDEALFKRIVKDNPYSGTYSKMQLFLRYQIEEYAYKKWGGGEGLDKEWLRREEMRVKRRDKKFETKLNDMKKKMRAEEFTRKIRKFNQRHEHEWSEPLGINSDENGDNGSGGNSNLIKRRCLQCGMETEEIIM